MKKITTFFILCCAVFILAFSFTGDKTNNMLVNNVVIQFEGTNANGNNLWLDNFSFGERYNNDLTITNIGMKDKNYLMPGVTSKNFSPVTTVFNVGRSSSGTATITMTDQGSYTSTKNVPSISAGATTNITFDPITFTSNVSKNIKVFITWASDENHFNDTINQATVFLPGVQKKIVFEAHTSTTCGPCASQNPALDAFIQQHFDSIVPIKYHVWWPALGDPMYAANIPQQRVRTHYNSISAVPTLTVDGVHQQVSGYTTLSNLLNPFNDRRSLASPLAISVTDIRLTGDTIKATININVVSAFPSGVNYKLRICAIERKITYASPPGSNGETIFYDVFRRMYPSTDGMPINYSPGTYTVEYKYKRDASWVDSMMYTAVFIQDDNNHEIINAAKARDYYLFDKITQPKITDNSILPMTSNMPDAPTYAGNGLQVETMEATFPPAGWTIFNNDSNFTFWQYVYNPLSGPSFPGVKCVRINYYSYPENIGTKDIIRTKVFNNVNLNDSIKFDYAYAQRTPYEDRLTVKISTDGGTTFPYTIFDKQGAALGTAPPQSTAFTPATGQWGTFAARYGTVTGVEPVGNFTPNKFELLQNFPNPFNPITTIKYNIAKNCFVSIKIYDILGKEVITLVNSNLKAGQYEIKYNASNLTSGIYLYKIIAGGFTDVKKMILVK